MKARFFLLATLSVALSSCIGDVPFVMDHKAYVINYTDDSIYVECSFAEVEVVKTKPILHVAEKGEQVCAEWCLPNDSLLVFSGMTYAYWLDENMSYIRIYNTKNELLYEDTDHSCGRDGDQQTWEPDKETMPRINYFYFTGDLQ